MKKPELKANEEVIRLIPSLNNEEPEIEESQYTYENLMKEWGQSECGTEPLQWLLNKFKIQRIKK